MKLNLLNALSLGGPLWLAALPAPAVPLQCADVAADPAWVVHLDCDALRPTAVGKHILSEMDKPEAQAKLAFFQSRLNFDLRTQLHGVTVYSAGTPKDGGVALFYADFDPDRLTSFAKAAKDSQSASYKSRVIYSWVDENKKPRDGEPPRTYAAIAGKRVVLAQRETLVARALDVLDGLAPNLSSTRSLDDWAAAGAGGFLKAAATKLDIPTSNPGSALFKLARRILLQVGEKNDQLKAALTLEANDNEVAGQMATVAQGFLALLKLQQEKPEAVRLADALALKQDGARLEVNLALPASDVLGMIKAGSARKAEKKPRPAEQ